jgi:hypothetical protein
MSDTRVVADRTDVGELGSYLWLYERSRSVRHSGEAGVGGRDRPPAPPSRRPRALEDRITSAY